MSREHLSDDAIVARLDKIEGWERHGKEIRKTYELPSFPAALMFASTVGHFGEAMDHHPDILIQWRKVTLTLSTHSAGGLTTMDFDLATQIEALPMK